MVGEKQVDLGKAKYLGLTLYPALEKIRLGASHLLLALTIISPRHDGDRLFLGFAVLAPTCT